VQALRRALPMLLVHQLEAFRKRFARGRHKFTLEELVLAALSDRTLQAGFKKAEAEAATRPRPKPAGKGKARGAMSQPGESPSAGAV
jgi:hypothetical protein